MAGLAAVAPTRPDIVHAMFCRSGFDDDVRRWAMNHGAMLIGPVDLVAPFPTSAVGGIPDEPEREVDHAG